MPPCRIASKRAPHLLLQYPPRVQARSDNNSRAAARQLESIYAMVREVIGSFSILLPWSVGFREVHGSLLIHIQRESHVDVRTGGYDGSCLVALQKSPVCLADPRKARPVVRGSPAQQQHDTDPVASCTVSQDSTYRSYLCVSYTNDRFLRLLR